MQIGLGWSVKWCSEREVCTTRYDVSYILDFLEELFESVLQYRTIESHRSVISAFHGPIGGVNSGTILGFMC